MDSTSLRGDRLLNLPLDIFCQIMVQLPTHQIVKMLRLNKSWQQALWIQPLWQKLVLQIDPRHRKQESWNANSIGIPQPTFSCNILSTVARRFPGINRLDCALDREVDIGPDFEGFTAHSACMQRLTNLTIHGRIGLRIALNILERYQSLRMVVLSNVDPESKIEVLNIPKNIVSLSLRSLMKPYTCAESDYGGGPLFGFTSQVAKLVCGSAIKVLHLANFAIATEIDLQHTSLEECEIHPWNPKHQLLLPESIKKLTIRDSTLNTLEMYPDPLWFSYEIAQNRCEYWPDLEYINIDCTYSDTLWRSLMAKCGTKLEELIIGLNARGTTNVLERIFDEGRSHSTKLRKLKRLEISSELDDNYQMLKRLEDVCPELHILSLNEMGGPEFHTPQSQIRSIHLLISKCARIQHVNRINEQYWRSCFMDSFLNSHIRSLNIYGCDKFNNQELDQFMRMGIVVQEFKEPYSIWIDHDYVEYPREKSLSARQRTSQS